MADRKERPAGKGKDYSYRLKRMREHGLKPPIGMNEQAGEQPEGDFALDCGWGRLVFGQTCGADNGPPGLACTGRAGVGRLDGRRDRG